MLVTPVNWTSCGTVSPAACGRSRMSCREELRGDGDVAGLDRRRWLLALGDHRLLQPRPGDVVAVLARAGGERQRAENNGQVVPAGFALEKSHCPLIQSKKLREENEEDARRGCASFYSPPLSFLLG